MTRETNQKEIGTNVIPPTPVTLVGTMHDGKENYMAVGWCSRVNSRPPRIAVAIGHASLTNAAIKENQEFSVCIPGKDLVELTDYCGVVSGNKVDKSGLFQSFYGRLKFAPLIEEAPINLECRLDKTVELEADTLFVAEIVGAWARDEVMDGNKISLERARPMILTMPDNRYWELNTVVGKAWGDGLDYMKRNKGEE